MVSGLKIFKTCRFFIGALATKFIVGAKANESGGGGLLSLLIGIVFTLNRKDFFLINFLFMLELLSKCDPS